jgi:TRAP-type C4-dicarboxylate transport system permease small subunit
MKGFLDSILKINKLMQIIGGIALTLMITLTTADVILRALGRPILGAYEIVAICGGVVIGFTMPITSWMRVHISMDLLIRKLPDHGRNTVNIITRCVGIGSFLIISWNVMKIGISFRTGGEVTGTLQLPLYPIAYGIAVCFFILSIVLFCDILKIHGGSYE